MSALTGHFDKIISSPLFISEAVYVGNRVCFVTGGNAFNKKAAGFTIKGSNSGGNKSPYVKHPFLEISGNVGFANFGSGDCHGSFFLGRRGKIIPYLLYRNHSYVFAWFCGVLTTFLWITQGA